MKSFEYQTQGTCSSKIVFSLDGDVINEVAFVGGCPGNTQGLSRMVKGRKTEEVISLLEGIRCGNKPTSCPDQLAKALKEATARG